MSSDVIVESVATEINLSMADAQALTALGRTLHTQRADVTVDDSEEASEPTLIRCAMSPDGVWRLTVANAVGIVALGERRLVVVPKIPQRHLFHLFGEAELVPRIASSDASAAAGEDLWQLVCRWLVEAAELLLRRDLVRDYIAVSEEVTAARGHIDVRATADLYYGGRLHLMCQYDEFAADTSLNRLVKAGLVTVAASAEAGPATRRRALALLTRMEEIGSLRPGDLRAQPDRRTEHYHDTLLLSRAVLLNSKRTIAPGNQVAWSFLISTPALVEDGVRNILRRRLDPSWDVRKQRLHLTGSHLSVAPDLLFGHTTAVADVKYKLTTERWRRPDLYEVAAFAIAADARHAAIIGFSVAGGPAPPPLVRIGDMTVRYFGWDAHDETEPEASAARLADGVEEWLAGLCASQTASHLDTRRSA